MSSSSYNRLWNSWPTSSFAVHAWRQKRELDVEVHYNKEPINVGAMFREGLQGHVVEVRSGARGSL